jgi:membrane peptidoglycan carboxypeptidase
VVPGMVTTHVVLSPALDSQVQFAMEATTVDGTGTAAAMTDGRPIIGKTGTTTNSKSAFFLGAIPQYSLAVGIFTQSQNPNSPQTLTALGGGGFGGTWPAAIWHTFAEAEFSQLPAEQFLSPVFTGAKWNQVGNIPKKKKKTPKHGTPTPTPGHGHHGHNPFPTPTPTFTFGQPTTTPSATASPTGTATATPTSTATATGPPGQGGGAAVAAAKVNGVQAGVALGGVFSVLPGSLLWARASRRRRRRRSGVVG